MSITKTLLALIWYVLLLMEGTIWVSTIAYAGWYGLISFLAFATIVPLLLAIEGLELAVTSLLGSKPNLARAAGQELDHIRGDRMLPFFPNRQVFVVASIVVLTMASAFDRLYVPGIGWMYGYDVPALFNLTFPTFVVLMFAQVPGKMLALYSPTRFFGQTWWLCVAVRWVGALELTMPARPITKLLASFLGYPVQHEPATPEIRLVYPVFDHIDNQWVYVLHQDGKAAADAV